MNKNSRLRQLNQNKPMGFLFNSKKCIFLILQYLWYLKTRAQMDNVALWSFIIIHKRNFVKKNYPNIIYIQDYIRLQSEMLLSLEKYFTSDNTSNSVKISSYWNNFFIKVTTLMKMKNKNKQKLTNRAKS